MFEGIHKAPPDPIFGLMAAFRADPNPEKINLGAGIYRDEHGATPVLEAVREAQRRIAEHETSKTYLAIEGDPRFASRAQQLQLGTDLSGIDRDRFATAHTPGGTGAIRVAADVVRAHRGEVVVWLPDPTWINHAPIFRAAGLRIETFPYLDGGRRGLDSSAMLAKLEEVAVGDLVVLHGCCHNPSGIDPTAEQWASLAELLRERQAVPLIDCAYQGFGQGLEEDTAGLRALCKRLPELIVCTSFSKNFALYNERVGILSMVTSDAATAEAVLSQIRIAARVNYSNPPAHGAAIVATILEDADLRERWQAELAAMRGRIQEMRRLFVSGLTERQAILGPGGNDFLLDQQGMFSFSGLQPDQIERLREQHSIYIVGSGRVNFAGMTPGNMDRLCDAIARVVSPKSLS